MTGDRSRFTYGMVPSRQSLKEFMYPADLFRWQIPTLVFALTLLHFGGCKGFLSNNRNALGDLVSGDQGGVCLDVFKRIQFLTRDSLSSL